jgi:hypothetical protein
MDIWNILWPFGTFCVHFVHFSGFWYHAPRKIWQPCSRLASKRAKLFFIEMPESTETVESTKSPFSSVRQLEALFVRPRLDILSSESTLVKSTFCEKFTYVCSSLPGFCAVYDFEKVFLRSDYFAKIIDVDFKHRNLFLQK